MSVVAPPPPELMTPGVEEEFTTQVNWFADGTDCIIVITLKSFDVKFSNSITEPAVIECAETVVR